MELLRRHGVWAPVAGFAAWAVFRLFGLDGWYPGMQLMAFTPYVALASLLAPVAALLARNRAAAVAAGTVAVALAVCVLPRAIPDRDAMDGVEIRVMSANLLAGGAEAGSVTGLVRRHRVDVLAVQELTPDGQRALDAAGLAELLPYRAAHPVPGVVGSAVYARFPLRDLGLEELPSTFGQARAVVAVPGSGEVEVVSVHPCAPAPGRPVSCWSKDFARLPAATPNGTLRLLVGDFNATLDHRAVRRLLATGYRDAAATTGAGLVPTWRGRWWVPGVTLDRVVVDRRVWIRAFSVHDLPDSDHRAVVATLVLPALRAG